MTDGNRPCRSRSIRLHSASTSAALSSSSKSTLAATSPTRSESVVAADIGRLVDASAEDRAAAADSLDTDSWRTAPR